MDEAIKRLSAGCRQAIPRMTSPHQFHKNFRQQDTINMAFKLFKKKSSKKSKKVVEEIAAPATVEDKPLLQEPEEPKPEPEETESPSVASESPSEEVPKDEEKESWMSKMSMNCCV
ncbi:MAG: hypothetical protein SGBAC_005804 [Bacillariaceae sp.]